MTLLEAPTKDVALHVEGLSKAFGGVRALRDLSLSVRPGTVHALLGSNGSGKSTLIKILAGIYAADGCESFEVFGTPHALEKFDPSHARAAGLRFVHQDPGFFLDRSVAENMALSSAYPTRAAGFVDWTALHRNVRKTLDRFEVDVDPRTPMIRLSAANRAMIGVARALGDGDEADRRVLVLDEPTVSLPRHEVDLLLAWLRRRTAAGQTTIFVTHRLQEALSIADEMTVLRDGRNVATLATTEVDNDTLVGLISGSPVERTTPPAPSTETRRQDSPRLSVKSLESATIDHVSFDLQPGEIVGIAGLAGSGRTDLLRVLFGDLPRFSGQVILDGVECRLDSPQAAIRAGVAYVPADRVGSAAFMDRSVSENMSATLLKRYFQRGWLRLRQERRDAIKVAREFGVKAGHVQQRLANLSGGNQQKVILARWLRTKPRLLLLDEPTQGVDVAARADIYKLLQRTAAEGTAILIASSDEEELASLSHRVICLRHGRLSGELAGPQVSAMSIIDLSQRATEVA